MYSQNKKLMTSIAERHKYILDNINQKGFVKVADLAEALGVTPTTIRKDLNILESRGDRKSVV